MASASRFYLSLAFFCLALLAIVTICRADETKSDDEKTIRDDDVSARIQSRSGKIMIVRDNDGDNSGDGSGDGSGDDSGDGVDDNDNDDNDDDDNDNDDDDDDDDDFSDDNEDLLSFEMDAIQEKDADGNDVGTLEKHSVDSFDKVDFTISGVQRDGDYQGLKTVNINMSTFLDDPKANLEVMLYLFREDGTVTFGSETFAVQAGTVKFNVKVSNWDFCDGSPVDCSEAKAGEFLDISMKIRSKGSPAEVDDEDRKKKVCKKEKPDNDNNDGPENDNDDDDDCPIIYDMGGDSEMLLNKGVMNDYSKYTAMPPGFPKFEIEDGEKKFKFRIPKFDDNVVVDPSVTPGRVPKRAASHACWHQLHFGFTVFLLVVALFAAN